VYDRDLLRRVGEIAEEVDQDPRAAYFRYRTAAPVSRRRPRAHKAKCFPLRQMENGMYVRMAILRDLLCR
jgi:aspartate carbamoyltransferase catalytic subunit